MTETFTDTRQYFVQIGFLFINWFFPNFTFFVVKGRTLVYIKSDGVIEFSVTTGLFNSFAVNG